MEDYPSDLAEWINQRGENKSTHAAATASFLAVSVNVRDAIEAGFDLKTIWEHLREKKRILFRYETFLKYVHRHGLKTTKKRSPRTTGIAATSFSFSSNPKKEELL